MKLRIEILRLLAGLLFPVGTAHKAFGCGTVPGLYSLKKPVPAMHQDGRMVHISRFSDGTCLLHQHHVQADGRWEPMDRFRVSETAVEAKLQELAALAREVA
ncbi:MAG: hypothetical protein Q8Q36_02575 [bacterium]|nr:hypothetical protein [bacterium]